MGRDARKPVVGVYEQQSRRPACASAQTDQRLCYAVFGKYHNVNLIRVKFKFSSWSQKLRRKVSNSLCRQPRRQVFSRRAPHNIKVRISLKQIKQPSLPQQDICASRIDTNKYIMRGSRGGVGAGGGGG